MNVYDDKKGQDLDKYEDEGEEKEKNVEYILFPFVAAFSPSQKESNRLINMGKRTKSLNHLICIPKFYYLEKF